ncbi:Uncharacterised protein [uncultured archaeon]|nr:Uncharacterised protein [uncultured archaeon]
MVCLISASIFCAFSSICFSSNSGHDAFEINPFLPNTLQHSSQICGVKGARSFSCVSAKNAIAAVSICSALLSYHLKAACIS